MRLKLVGEISGASGSMRVPIGTSFLRRRDSCTLCLGRRKPPSDKPVVRFGCRQMAKRRGMGSLGLLQRRCGGGTPSRSLSFVRSAGNVTSPSIYGGKEQRFFAGSTNVRVEPGIFCLDHDHLDGDEGRDQFKSGGPRETFERPEFVFEQFPLGAGLGVVGWHPDHGRGLLLIGGRRRRRCCIPKRFKRVSHEVRRSPPFLCWFPLPKSRTCERHSLCSFFLALLFSTSWPPHVV